MIDVGNMSGPSRIAEDHPVDRAVDRGHDRVSGDAPKGSVRVKEFIMRYYPAAIALSLLIGVRRRLDRFAEK